jgi:hypothetical protein
MEQVTVHSVVHQDSIAHPCHKLRAICDAAWWSKHM